MFCESVSDVVKQSLHNSDIDVFIQSNATVVDQSERRNVTRQECVAAGFTHCRQVVARHKGSAFTLFELPVMENGVFIIKGKPKIIMLKKRRANVPVRIAEYITVLGGKLDVHNGKIIAPGTNNAVSVENVVPWCDSDPKELISYLMEHKFDACWHTNDVAATRIQTPGQLLKTLVRHVLNHCKFVQSKTKTWPHQMASAAIESAMATGNWKGGACGVTQLLNTNNELATNAHFRTVVGCNNDADRYVHPSTWCLFCCSETPEGEKCGLVHHLTENARITLEEHSDVKPPKRKKKGKYRLFWNGVPHGYTSVAPKTVQCRFRTVGGTPEIWAWCDAGHLVHKNAQPDPSEHMLGMAASMIPFAQHNQSPRVSYYSAMSKQAMQCGEQGKHRLCYAQQSLVKPFSRAGINVVIAIIPMGWNIEDALVFNKCSVERGLFRSITSNTYVHTEQKYLAGDVIPEGTILGGQKLKFNETVVEVLARADETFVTRTEVVRTPEVGDKFCSRAGQKGTMGIALPQQDMPFNQDGISPDVVINPHAFPSRMTVSQILETAAGKLRCYGVHVDGTPFRNTFKIKDARELLKQQGFDSSGKETMMCGKTGQPLKSKIFMGLCFYQRLHHMAKEKCYSRKGGPVDAVTMQPVAGRKVGGGIRLGEMEKDCMNAGGCMGTLTERMQSIGHSRLVMCNRCALPKQTCNCRASVQPSRNLFVPHATKLLISELQSMLIKVHIT